MPFDIPTAWVVGAIVGLAAVYVVGLLLFIVGVVRHAPRLLLAGTAVRTGAVTVPMGVLGVLMLALPLWVADSPWWTYPLALLGLIPLVTAAMIGRLIIRGLIRAFASKGGSSGPAPLSGQ